VIQIMKSVRVNSDGYLIEITELSTGMYSISIYELRTCAYPFKTLEEALKRAKEFISDC